MTTPLITNTFEFRFIEHIEALNAVQRAADERVNLAKQYKYLEFVTASYPDAVIEYLTQEPQHFAGLAQQTTDAGMAGYVRSVADRIFQYSIVGRFFTDMVKLTHKPGEAQAADVIGDLLKQAEEAEAKQGE